MGRRGRPWQYLPCWAVVWMHGMFRAQRPVRLPVMLSHHEVASLLAQLRGAVWLMASQMYGAGFGCSSAEVRVKDINLDRSELTIRDGKGGKDRVTMLPAALTAHWSHMASVKTQQ